MSDFQQKTVIVTGASSGIGRATAIAFGAAGANVMISARRPDAANDTVQRVSNAGGQCCFVQGDVADEGHCRAVVERALDEFGAVHATFNNAGIEGESWIPTAEYSVEEFDQVIAVNLRGMFLSMKYQLPQLIKTRGAVVNMASIAGLIGGKLGCAYYASKHAVIGLTKATAAEYAEQGVRVNALAPAVIRTEMADRLFLSDPEAEKRIVAGHPIGRLGTPEEVAELVLYLCSEKAGFITGETIKIDGGRTIGP